MNQVPPSFTPIPPNPNMVPPPPPASGSGSKMGWIIAIIVLVLVAIFVGVPFAVGVFSGIDSALKDSGQPVTPATTDTTSQLVLKTDGLTQPVYNIPGGFQINPPKDWRVDNSGQLGTLVIFTNTQTDRAGDSSFGANINVTSESTQGLNLADYVSATKGTLAKLLQDYETTEDKRVSVNGTEAQMIGGTFTQGVFPLRNLQLIVVKDGKAYVTTGTVLNSAWDKNKDLIEASLMTFQSSPAATSQSVARPVSTATPTDEKEAIIAGFVERMAVFGTADAKKIRAYMETAMTKPEDGQKLKAMPDKELLEMASFLTSFVPMTVADLRSPSAVWQIGDKEAKVTIQAAEGGKMSTTFVKINGKWY